jgi:hypothetical protein
MTILIVLLASLMLVAGAKPATSLPKTKPLVGFENGRLTIKAADVLLKDLLSEVQAKSGIAIELKDSTAAEKRSFVEIKSLPPALVFQSILRDFNFAFFYSGTRLARVLILPSGDQSHKAKNGLVNPDRIGRPFPRAEHTPLKPGAMPTLQGQNSKGSDVMAKLEAIEALEDSDDPKSVAALGDALTDQDRRVKEAALRALEHKEEAGATQMLRRGLNDSDPEFRVLVLEALANRGDLDSLRKALADRNHNVRETAADLLESATSR